MSLYTSRMFISSSYGYMLTFWDAFLLRETDVGFLETYLPLPLLLKRKCRGTSEQILAREVAVKNWKLKHWGMEKDIYCKDKVLTTEKEKHLAYASKRFDFDSNQLPTIGLKNIANEFPHISFEMWSQSEELDLDRSLAILSGKVIHESDVTCGIKQGGFSSRFHRWI